MPDIENSRKAAEKGAEWLAVEQPKNSLKNSRNTRKTAVLTVFRVFPLFLRLFSAALPRATRHPFRLFSNQCRAFGTSVFGRGDCKAIAIPLLHRVSCSIVDYRCYTPTSFCKRGLSQSKTDLTRGVPQKSLDSEAYRAVAGVARNSILVAPCG